jgi:transporter family-2 protein
MIFNISLAIFNGILIGSSRAINGRLGVSIGAFGASFWNHMIGFALLSLLLMAMGQLQPDLPVGAPFRVYLGGFFGAFFVAVNSFVFPKLGATHTTLLVIAGQMVSAVLLDYRGNALLSIIPRLLGVSIILVGIYLSKTNSEK